jgi:ubiquinone/menaquinone biosynthesis C-methylase UbiE
MLRDLLHRAVAHPAVYDRVQALAGDREVRRRLAPFIAAAEGIVLDLGGGTGNSQTLVRPPGRYVLVDIDREKIDGFVRKRLSGEAVRCDVTQLCFGGRSVHTALCMAVSHHLDDTQLRQLFAEAARVVAGRFVFLDPVRTDRLTSRALWRYDRGSYPRRAEELKAAMGECFVIEHAEQFTIHHTYVLMLGAPYNA